MSSISRTRLPVDERREQLLRLGLRLFSERPYEAVSVDEIASAAGISRGLLYHYFPGKRDFYVAVVRVAVAELSELIQPQPGLSASEALSNALRAYVDYVSRRRHGYLTATQGGLGADPEIAALVEGFRQQVVDQVLAAVGVADPGLEVRASLRGWVGYVESVVAAWLRHGDLDADRIVVMAVDTLRANLERMGLDVRPLIEP